LWACSPFTQAIQKHARAAGNEHARQQSVQTFLTKQDDAQNFSPIASDGCLLIDLSAIIHTANTLLQKQQKSKYT
jgi:hypothetical protein